jgi:hypothetical protein
MLPITLHVLELFIRTYAEEEIAKQFPTEREWVYNFANASMMTENWQFGHKKVYPLVNFFFSVGNKFILFHNFNTATHDRLKNLIFR